MIKKLLVGSLLTLGVGGAVYVSLPCESSCDYEKNTVAVVEEVEANTEKDTPCDYAKDNALADTENTEKDAPEIVTAGN